MPSKVLIISLAFLCSFCTKKIEWYFGQELVVIHRFTVQFDGYESKSDGTGNNLQDNRYFIALSEQMKNYDKGIDLEIELNSANLYHSCQVGSYYIRTKKPGIFPDNGISERCYTKSYY